MGSQHFLGDDLQHRITILEQANAELQSKNLGYEAALRELEQRISEQVDAGVLRELVDDISHDLRLPLTTMTTYIYLLKHNRDNVDTPHYLDVLEKQLMYLTDVINNLINMVRLDMKITQFELQLLQINPLLADIIEALLPLAVPKKQTISTDFAPNMPSILGDRLKITRALMNIVQNAITYTPEHGHILVRSSVDGTAYICVEIADTGIGIAEENLPRIFDRFYRVNKAQTEGGNSGLGLAITQQIIENHRGRIEVESELNKGTRFRVCLPTLAALTSSTK